MVAPNKQDGTDTTVFASVDFPVVTTTESSVDAGTGAKTVVRVKVDITSDASVQNIQVNDQQHVIFTLTPAQLAALIAIMTEAEQASQGAFG